MPDNKIFEAMIENQLTDLLEQSKDLTKFTSLESKLIPVVVARIRAIGDLEKRKKYVEHYNTGIGNYIDLLEVCEKASLHGYGYSIAQVDSSGRGGEYYLVDGERRLKEFESLQLVSPTDKQMRRVTMLQLWEAGNYLGPINEVGTARMSTIYRITDHGKALLEEHRKIKSEKGEREDKNTKMGALNGQT